MKLRQSALISWIRLHKRALALAGVSIVSIIALVLCMKNHNSIMKLWKLLREIVENSSAPTCATKETILSPSELLSEIKAPQNPIVPSTPFNVRGHIRNLPEGWSPSPEKIATAMENGFYLAPRQTWVVPCTKGNMA